MELTVRIDWVSLGLVAALGMVLAALYAVALSTERGRQVCEGRTHWTVMGGHLLMALTMCVVSPAVAGLWLLWSAVHGLPLVIRSEALRWRADEERKAAFAAGLRAVMGNEARGYSGGGNGHGDGGAGG
jgi:hypothetical protein